MKVIIPVAGLGSRLKPHTFTTPKPLMEVAGKPIIDYIVSDVLHLKPSEVIFVVGYRGDQIKNYIKIKYPQLNLKFVTQEVRDGDGSAIRLALEDVDNDEDLFIVFGDTMVDLDYKKIIKESKDLDSLVLTMRVEFPKHYGVAETDKNNYIKSIEEKPENPKSNRAVIGAYYFKSLQKVKKILDDLYDKKETIKGEYKIAQVNEIFVRAGDLKIKAFDVDKWFDCGRPEVLLDANKYFLELLSERKSKFRGDSLIVPPSYIAKDAVIENSIVGPNVSIGSGAYIRDSCIKNSIIGPGARIENLVLKDSLVGKEASMKGKATRINMSEKSELSFFE